MMFHMLLVEICQANVSIGNAGQTCLTGFGLPHILEALSGTTSTTSNLAGSIRWMAPELLASFQPTIFTDMYAFGSLVPEVRSCPSLVD